MSPRPARLGELLAVTSAITGGRGARPLDLGPALGRGPAGPAARRARWLDRLTGFGR